MTDDPSAAPEQDLVDNIARAMQNRPLMRRLANVGSAFGAAPDASSVAPAAVPEPGPQARGGNAQAEPPASVSLLEDELAKIKRRVEEAEEAWAMPPSSAEWLGKAQRERNRARLRNAVAWLATLLIGGAIIAATALMLQP